ncbi:IclR-like transcriptional regulator [Halogeometricum pallidum JCM 14848]|uniref:IclR-like transcriptional regulator n=1 Tax=Halogeometricum pallidum JCM 14848 TaxID=1227487 RepID=M0CXU2_HALPD|nr:helix-turn-helix domain-containing protein [Halogeometricum pallidum]ELZ28036.1 IclR-like transcriptional regulator [Halogeometricum pallidum JCM 14848]
MSQSTMAPMGVRHREHSDENRTVSDASEVESFFDVLDDGDCRAILRATSEEALSAGELSEECDIPLSTTYRKLESLTEAGLLEESLRLRRSGKHTSEYRRRVDDIVVSMDAAGDFSLSVTRRERAERSTYSSVAGGR